MQLTLLKQNFTATVTEANLNYTGSITIDKDLLTGGILVWEKVCVVDINNGQRFETYVIEGGRQRYHLPERCGSTTGTTWRQDHHHGLCIVDAEEAKVPTRGVHSGRQQQRSEKICPMLNIAITAGGTSEQIDGVRRLTNVSTGLLAGTV